MGQNIYNGYTNNQEFNPLTVQNDGITIDDNVRTLNLSEGLSGTQGDVGTIDAIVDAGELDIDTFKVSKLYQPDETNAFVYTDNGGSLHIDGDITQTGSTYETHAEKLYTTNDFIKTRDGAIAGLGAGEISGIEVLLYDGANNLIFGTDSDGYFKVGETGDLQILATREDTPEDGGVAFWDDTNKRFDTDTGFIWDDVNKRLGIGITPTQALDVAGAVKIAGKLTGLSNGTANSDAVNFSQLNTKLNTSDFGTSFDTAFSGKSTSNLSEGTNLYYTSARFDTAFSGKSTSNLTEGTNLYYTEARVSANATVAGNVSAITKLNNNVNTAGSVLKMIKDNSQNATFTNTTSGLSATTIVGAINEIEGRVDTVQTLDGVKVSKLYQPNGTNPLIGVDNSGNVGIGKSSPSHKLDVAGDLNIANNEWFSALDYSGTGVVNMFKVNEDNEIDVGGTLNIGTLSLVEDSGAVTLVNMPVSSTPTAGDEMSYSFSLDSNVVAKVYAEADGSGGIQNPAFQITGDLTASGDVTITGDITGNNLSGTNTGDNAVNSLYSSLTQYTDEMAQDAIGTILVDTSEIDFTYNDTTPSITASLKNGSIDESKLDTSVNASLDKADSAVQNLSGFDTGDLSEGTNLYYTDARVSANSSVAANTAKVGITTAQASAITANTAKISYDSTASTKLGTIETNADVTDTTNVTAAGALMKTGGSITGNLSVSGNIHTAIKTITSTTSLSVNDANMVVCNSSSNFTVTLPTVTTGVTYMIKNINTGTVTIDGYSTQLIDDNSSIYIQQWESVTLVSNGTIWLIN